MKTRQGLKRRQINAPVHTSELNHFRDYRSVHKFPVPQPIFQTNVFLERSQCKNMLHGESVEMKIKELEMDK